MADLKPLGSEKLNGDDKIKRILELTYYNTNNKKNNSSKPEIVFESKTSGVFGIVKEKDGYYVKRGLNENSLDYIGGMFMKNKNKFTSYAEALKRLNLIKGQEELNEATKYVLKTNKPQEESPAPVPSMDSPSPELPSPELPPASGGDASMGSADSMIATEPSEPTEPTEPEDSMGDAKTNKRSDYMSEVQKFAGKLGQELRDQKERMESDDIKYVLNMIISAVDLSKLDKDDLEDIGGKFEVDEDEMSPEDEDEMDSEEEVAPEDEMGSEGEVTPDDDLGETMDLLNDFINSSMDTDDEINEYKDEDVEIDLNELKKDVNKSINDIFSKYFK